SKRRNQRARTAVSTALSRVSAKVAAAWPPPDRGGCHAEHHDGSSVGRGVRPLARAVPGAAGAGRAATLGAHLSGGASLAGRTQERDPAGGAGRAGRVAAASPLREHLAVGSGTLGRGPGRG